MSPEGLALHFACSYVAGANTEQLFREPLVGGGSDNGNEKERDGGIVFLGGAFTEAAVARRALVSFAIAWAVPAVLVALLWNIGETRKKKISLVAMVFQLVVLSGAVYYYTYHYGVWRLGWGAAQRTAPQAG